jgi:hypothetical protein
VNQLARISSTEMTLIVSQSGGTAAQRAQT